MCRTFAGVSETMLLALHSRAGEAKQWRSCDPEGLRIYKSMNYDFSRRFGEFAGALAVRAAEIDRVLRQWLAQHRDGFVVSLGEGLETQARRVDNGRVRWLSGRLPRGDPAARVLPFRLPTASTILP